MRTIHKRRASNLPLAQVAERAGISPGRVSQIQTEIERKAVRPQAEENHRML